MKYDYIFDSSSQRLEAKFQMNSESDAPITIFFEKEGILLQADPHGNAIFRNTNGREIYRDKADGNHRLFRKIYVKAESDAITVRFPLIEWRDTYPNCDGEYDRWIEVITGNICITCPLAG